MLEQLSMPYRIALGALLVLAIAWFTVLKPGDDPAPAAPVAAATTSSAPGVTGLTNDVAKARGAAAASEGANAATADAVADVEGATTATTREPAATTTSEAAATATPTASTTTTKAKATPTDPATRVLAALDRGDVAVLAFLQPGGADDARVRAALKRLTGPVSVHTADIDRVGDYAAITRGVPVSQGPTTLVIGADRKAEVVTGLTTRGELQQLVDDQADR